MTKPISLLRTLVGQIKLSDLPFVAAWAAVLAVLPVAIWAQTVALTIVSGPSVGGIIETQAVVTWQTDTPSTSVVSFGVTESLGQVFRKIIPMEETEIMEVNHSITLWELKPGTTYYYRVTSVSEGGVSVSSAVKTFDTTAPTPTCTADEWDCGGWGACSDSGTQSRVCTLRLDCAGIDTPQPISEQPCVPTCDKDEWSCGEWGTCSDDGQQTRECFLKTDCAGVETPVPPTVQPCVPPAKMQEKLVPVELLPQEPIIKPDPVPPSTEVISSPLPPPPPPPPEPAPEPGRPVSDVEVTAPAVAPVLPAPPVAPISPAASSAVAIEEIMSAPAMPSTPDDVCVRNGISPERCDAWLGVKFGDKRCAEAGIMGRSACADHLAGINGGVFPGCDGKSEVECGVIRGLLLNSYVAEEKIEADNAVIGEALERGDVAVALASVAAAVRPELAGEFSLRPSAGRPDQQTSPAVLILDRDLNGVPDNLDAELAVAEDAAPLRDDPTVRALLAGAELEQPRGGGEVDAGLTVAASPATSAGGTGKGTALHGTCAPGAACLIYVYSYMPLVLTTIADENGDWSYDLGESLADGEHTVYVVVTDETGKIARKSNPMSLFVSAAQAVSAEDFLRPDMQSLTAAPVERQQRWYLLGVAAAVALAIVVVAAMFLRKPRRTSMKA